MSFTSINPANGRQVWSGPGLDATEIEQALAAAAEAAPRWAATPVDERCRIVRRAADIQRARRAELAALITLEMGKLVEQARDEVEKCAAGCEYYAEHAPGYFTDAPVGGFRSSIFACPYADGSFAYPRALAVTPTGCYSAGRMVAAAAGAHLKK